MRIWPLASGSSVGRDPQGGADEPDPGDFADEIDRAEAFGTVEAILAGQIDAP